MSASVIPDRGLSDEDWLRNGLRFHAEVKEMVTNESVRRFYPGLADELIDWH